MLGTLIRMVIGLTQKDDITTQDETFFILSFQHFCIIRVDSTEYLSLVQLNFYRRI